MIDLDFQMNAMVDRVEAREKKSKNLNHRLWVFKRCISEVLNVQRAEEEWFLFNYD